MAWAGMTSHLRCCVAVVPTVAASLKFSFFPQPLKSCPDTKPSNKRSDSSLDNLYSQPDAGRGKALRFTTQQFHPKTHPPLNENKSVVAPHLTRRYLPCTRLMK